MTSHKILTVFGEVCHYLLSLVSLTLLTALPQLQSTALQAEKRGNFVVVGCVEGTRVISWSLNVSSIPSRFLTLPMTIRLTLNAHVPPSFSLEFLI